MPPDSPALHLIQHIRDDSHHHAITGHRQRRSKVKNTSALELIEGVGPKRRQILLKYMGGLQPLLNASVEEIAKVPSISQALAEKNLQCIETLKLMLHHTHNIHTSQIVIVA